MNRKISFPIALAIIIVLAVLVGGGCLCYFYGKGAAELVAGPVEKNPVSCVIKGADNKDYNVIVGKFDTPYIPNCKRPFASLDLSKIEDVIDSGCSAVAYGWNNYLSLGDQGFKADLARTDAEQNGAYSKSLNGKIGKFSELDYPEVYTYWVEFNKGGKTYRVISGEYAKKEDQNKFPDTRPERNLVLENGKWLDTNDLLKDDLVRTLSILNYSGTIGKCLK